MNSPATYPSVLNFLVNSDMIAHAVNTNGACKAVWPDKRTENAADVKENLFPYRPQFNESDKNLGSKRSSQLCLMHRPKCFAGSASTNMKAKLTF